MSLEWQKNSGKLQIISGKFQNNAVNDAKQISMSHGINFKILEEIHLLRKYTWSCRNGFF